MTPLQRPRELAGKVTLTAEEAAAYEQRENERLDDYDRSPSVHAKWWLDYGRALTEDRRTSLIVDPPDGRLPAVTEDARRRAAARSEQRSACTAANAAEYRGLTERCITFGMPRLPGAYNNNFQILQTPTHVAIVSEMIHDARIAPARRPPAPAGGPAAVARRLARLVRRRHAGGRDRQLLAQERVPRLDREAAARGAVHPRRPEHRPLRGHDVGPGHLGALVDRAGPDDEDRPPTRCSTSTPATRATSGCGTSCTNARYEEDPDYADKLPAPGQN